MSTLQEVLASQDELLKEAREALPHDFKHCTFPLGSLRQAVYLCLTCNSPRGICSACSIACHTDHEQIELFPKRDFRCDCPTKGLEHRCTLHTTLEEVNGGNQYGQNFQGHFCRCGRTYDANKERETMIQCLVCEDWLHESCLNLRERPPSREPSPVPSEPLASESATSQDPAETTPEETIEEVALSEASSSGLPTPLIPGSSYDSMVCGSCVRTIPTLKRYAGTPGVIMVTRYPGDPSAPWKRMEDLEGKGEEGQVDVTSGGLEEEGETGKKRARSPSGAGEPIAKKARTEGGPCLAPPLNLTAQQILNAPQDDTSLGAGDVFLTEGWRGRWCHCNSCKPSLEAHPYLLEEEETYEPPEDPDSRLSLEELGMRALSRLPRERAIDGIHAYNKMKEGLIAYLRPFAEQGQVVEAKDVDSFFEQLKSQ